MSNTPTQPPPPNFGNQIPLPGLADAARAIGDLTREIQGLKAALGALGGASSGAGAQVGNIFKNLTTGANNASGAMRTLFSQMTGSRPGGTSVGSLLDYGMQGDFGHDLALFPLRFMQSSISASRQLAYNAASSLSGIQYAQARPMGAMLGSMSGQMGTGAGRYGLRGTADEISQTFATARQFGAMYDFATPIGGVQGSPRTEGFFRGTAELANMYPGASLPGLAQTLGGFSGNTAAQQRSLFMSGGAFGMIGQGGAQKTVSQWAESILNFMEDQRFGAQRGNPFTYPELLSNNFPGSNIDAWLDINGVPPDMKEVWWNYALNKAKTSSTQTTGGVGIAIAPQKSNLAYQRSLAVSATTRPQLQFAQTMNPAYVSREKSNTEFNALMGQFIKDALSGSKIMDVLAHIPDTVEEFLMQFIENSGAFGSILGGSLGYGTMGLNLFSNLFSEGGLLGSMDPAVSTELLALFNDKNIDPFGGTTPAQMGGALPTLGLPGGDVGDTGWGAMGGRGTGSLHPDVGSKVNRMMRANPRLRMNSGRRDEVTQRSLRGKGYSRVSGKSSAHTRGLAADLGPASEYGWITANASRFGLQSGAKHGEPWHVGMNGIGDTSDNVGIGALFANLLGGVSFSDVESIFPAFFTMLAPTGGGTALTEAQAEERYSGADAGRLVTASNYALGGEWGGTTFAEAFTALMTAAGVASGVAGMVGAGMNAATLAEAVQALGRSSTGLSSGAMTAILANAAGFTGSDLVTAVAIAGRESGYDPKAFHNDPTGSQDLSYGLFQINMLGNLGPARREAYGLATNEELFNPLTNLRVAHAMAYENSTPFYAWGPYKGMSATYDTDVNAAQGYVTEAGLGDIDSYGGGGSIKVGGSRMTFNNTFVLSGGSGGANAGIDVRRAASQIADHLENEMRGRLERAN